MEWICFLVCLKFIKLLDDSQHSCHFQISLAITCCCVTIDWKFQKSPFFALSFLVTKVFLLCGPRTWESILNIQNSVRMLYVCIYLIPAVYKLKSTIQNSTRFFLCLTNIDVRMVWQNSPPSCLMQLIGIHTSLTIHM